MNTSKIGEWLKVGVSISVLAGVLLVAWEVNQNTKLAAHERVSDVSQMWTEIILFEYENDVWLLYKKSIETPQDLTDRDLLRLDTWLGLIMDTAVSNDFQNRAHGLQSNVTERAALYAEYYFSGLFSRAWLKDNTDWYVEDAPELIEKLLEEIDKTPANTEFERLKRLRSY